MPGSAKRDPAGEFQCRLMDERPNPGAVGGEFGAGPRDGPVDDLRARCGLTVADIAHDQWIGVERDEEIGVVG